MGLAVGIPLGLGVLTPPDPVPATRLRVVTELATAMHEDDPAREVSGGCVAADGSLFHVSADATLRRRAAGSDTDEVVAVDATGATTAAEDGLGYQVDSISCGRSGRWVAWETDQDRVVAVDVEQRRFYDSTAARGPVWMAEDEGAVVFAADGVLHWWYPATGQQPPAVSGEESWDDHDTLEIAGSSPWAITVGAHQHSVFLLPTPGRGFHALEVETGSADAGLAVDAEQPLVGYVEDGLYHLVDHDDPAEVTTHRFRAPPAPTSVVGVDDPEIAAAVPSPSGRLAAAHFERAPGQLAVHDFDRDEEEQLQVGTGPVVDLSWVTSERYLLVQLGGSAGESGRLVVVEVVP